jgi:hypothetical protein
MAGPSGWGFCAQHEQEGREPSQMVSAWAVGQQLVLGQRKVAGDSNEIAALSQLLALLALDDRIVTAAAYSRVAGHIPSVRRMRVGAPIASRRLTHHDHLGQEVTLGDRRKGPQPASFLGRAAEAASS